MATAYTPILKLALPVTGELAGQWGDVVNNNITSMVEQAVAGLATINTWTANSHTLTTANGTTSESRCAMLVLDDDGAGNPSAAATVICPTETKAYIVRNISGQTVTVKTSLGTGVAVPNNQSALVFCDGTNVVTGSFNGDVVGPASATNTAIAIFDGTTGKLIKNTGVTIDGSNNVSGVAQLNATTLDATNLEVTNLKAKDGTAAGSIADSTGVVTLASSVLTTTAISGGTVNNVTIGGTTAAPGTFTNLAYTGTLTGGTGVVNIGSGQFVKDASGNVGIGSASPISILEVFKPSIAALFIGYNNTSQNYYDANDHIFRAGNSSTERMRIDSSGNVGIGTTPVFGAGSGLEIERASATATLRLQRATANPSSVELRSAADIGELIVTSNTPLAFGTNSTERMRIDSSGNVGIGTSSPDVRLTVSQTSTVGDLVTLKGANSVNGALGVHASNNGGVYLQAAATRDVRLRIGSTDHVTLDSSGNVGIGTSSPSSRLQVTDTNRIFDAFGNLNISTSDAATVGAGGAISFSGANTTGGPSPYMFAKIQGIKEGSASTYNGALLFGTTAGNSALLERMRIDSSGNVGIGTSSPNVANISGTALTINNSDQAIFEVNRAGSRAFYNYINSDGSRIAEFRNLPMTFFTNDTERARIDSSGNLMVGTTSSSQRFNVLGSSASAFVVRFSDDRGDGASGAGMVEFFRTSGVVGSITTSTTATSYNTSSDYRLKENVEPMVGALEKVAALKPCTYTWKTDGSAGQGFIAHELQEVVPDCVTGEKDAVDKDGKPQYQGVDTSFLIATLTAALQEQQALIQDLTTRLTALEGK